MKHSAMATSSSPKGGIALDRYNGFDVVAVWEYQNKKWKLLLVTRPQEAIALYWKNPETRLIFPVGFNPNNVGKETLGRKKRSRA